LNPNNIQTGLPSNPGPGAMGKNGGRKIWKGLENKVLTKTSSTLVGWRKTDPEGGSGMESDLTERGTRREKNLGFEQCMSF